MKDHENRVSELRDLLSRINAPIFIGYSGGKDSSAVVSLLWMCLKKYNLKEQRVTVIYCDTQVENPIIDRHAKSTLVKIEEEARSISLPVTSVVVEPRVEQSFFVRIIGRGYPSPTNSFRWCTKDIRIRPMRQFLSSKNCRSWIAIGTRFGESRQRDRALRSLVSRDDGEMLLQKQKDGFPNASLITPIIDYETADVWDLLCGGKGPIAIDPFKLAQIYKDGSGECPTMRDFQDKPCSKSRFGCWTCTVVRKDRSASNLIQSGHDELRPFFEFRNWLAEFRNNPDMRCKKRRNGSAGLGPFTIEGRLLILERLNELERQTGAEVLTLQQRKAIAELIEKDKASAEYALLEAE